MNVLGLDGSLQNFGLCVGRINLDKKKLDGIVTLRLSKTSVDKSIKRTVDDLARFRQHHLFIKDAIEEYNIELVFGEVPAGAQDARAAFAFGGVTALLASLPVPLVGVSPTEVKVASTGFKHADKEDIIEWAYQTYPYAPWITGKKANKMNIRTPEGLYLTNANEHLADSVGAIQAGLKKL